MAPVLDEAKLNGFIGRAVADWGALGSAALVRIGDRLGLYDALAEAGPVTSAELAARTGTVERYVREWLLNQAASETLSYDPASGRYGLPPEHAAALPNLVGGYELFLGAIRAEKRIADHFRTGGGLHWGEHDPDLFEGTERFFRPGYEQNIVQSWLPALEGVVAKLEVGASVADVGCGHGPRRSSWPRPIRARRSLATTITRPRLSAPVRRRARRVWPTGYASRSLAPARTQPRSLDTI